MSKPGKSYHNPSDVSYVDESFSRGPITSERQDAKALTVYQIEEKAIDYLKTKLFHRYGNRICQPSFLDGIKYASEAIHAALPPESEQIKILKNQMDMLLRTENAKILIQANQITALESQVNKLGEEASNIQSMSIEHEQEWKNKITALEFRINVLKAERAVIYDFAESSNLTELLEILEIKE